MDWNKLGKINVLIVEDDMFNRLLIVSLFAKNEYINVIESENGIEALQAMATTKVDIILLDLHMPKMDGFEMMRQMAKNKTTMNIPIMVLSSNEIEKKQSLALGASEFIPKPFDLKVLETQIYGMLQGQ